NNLTTLDLSQNTQLDTLYAEYNQLTTLKLGDNINLKVLVCDENNIQSLNVTQQSGLIRLSCPKNEIDSLDLSNAIDLQFLRCETNHLNYLDIRNKNGGLNSCHASGNPNLTCIFVDDEVFAENAPYYYKDSTAHWVETEAECDALGVEDFVFQDVNVYPNPVKNRLYIDCSQEINRIILFTLQGKQIKSIQDFIGKSIDVSDLNPGIYFLEVISNNQSQIQKIIKL